jgi:hypothetical protein
MIDRGFRLIYVSSSDLLTNTATACLDFVSLNRLKLRVALGDSDGTLIAVRFTVDS